MVKMGFSIVILFASFALFGVDGGNINDLLMLSSGCAIPSWYADNYCDDINNNAACNYDGGDCCGPNVNTWYCSDCSCKACYIESWYADGYCDDSNNNPGCDYDGGDCCGYSVNTWYCSVCDCIDPVYEALLG